MQNYKNKCFKKKFLFLYYTIFKKVIFFEDRREK